MFNVLGGKKATYEEVGIKSRAKLLAARIKEGADILATFAQRITAEEWKQPVSETDRRPIGVIIHHVASMYPIEIDLIKAIANGGQVPNVTWEAVAQINAQHVRDNADPIKAETIELLKQNSRSAAEEVSTLTDEELDRTAPIGLSLGAPVTAQFVIEDHPLRHSWHHLAKIRKALSR